MIEKKGGARGDKGNAEKIVEEPFTTPPVSAINNHLSLATTLSSRLRGLGSQSAVNHFSGQYEM